MVPVRHAGVACTGRAAYGYVGVSNIDPPPRPDFTDCPSATADTDMSDAGSRPAIVESPSAVQVVTPRAEFTRRVLIVTGVAVAAGAVLALLVLASDVVFLFFAAALLAILLRSASDALDRRTGLGPKWSFGLVVLAAAAIIVAGTYAVGSTAVTQFNHLVADLPRSTDQAREYLRQYPWGDDALRQMPAAGDLFGGSGKIASRATWFFSTTFGLLGNLLVLTVSALYLAASPRTYTAGLVALVPPARRPRAGQVLAAIGAQLRGWLIGRLVAMAAVGLIVGVGLWLVGVSQYLVLALVAAALTAIPFLGPILAAVPGILVALLQGPDTALWAVGVYVLSQAVENYLITPLVQQRMVNMPPVLTIAAVTLAGVLFGVLGMVVATPLAVAAVAAVEMLYVEDVLGDDLAVRGEGGAS